MKTKPKPAPTPADLKRRVRELTGHLKDLTACVECYLARHDAVMKGSTDDARGRRIAGLANALEMANDHARYFGLGIDYRGDGARKEKVRRAAEDAEKG